MIDIYGETETKRQSLLNAAITKEEIKQMRDAICIGDRIFLRFAIWDDSGKLTLSTQEWCTVKIKSTHVVVLVRKNGREIHLTYIDLCMLKRNNDLQREGYENHEEHQKFADKGKNSESD